ncbi:MAG: hypothetical protein KBC56_04845 [Flavobacterium sp.]|nr:hypothetical protein [Flavobacterium sp.]
MSIQDILNSPEFAALDTITIYEGHSIEKVNSCYQVRKQPENWLRFETNSSGTIEECKKHIDTINNQKS